MMDKIFVAFLGFSVGLFFGALIALGIGILPVIDKCERENALTEDQECVISAKVVNK